MTFEATDRSPDATAEPTLGDVLRQLPRHPAEGWTTLLLVGLMTTTVAWSIDDARWVLGQGRLTSFLPWPVIFGVLWGFVSAKAGWQRWLAHLLGAVFAALIVPILVGMVLQPNGSIGTWFAATADSVVQAYLDLAVRGRALTDEYGHFLLVLGMLCWATGQFASYAVFGHKRPLPAVAVVGLVLLTNMSITPNDQLEILIVYTAAALLLLARLHALDERASWLRRRIGDPGTVASLYMRGGTTFVTLAVIGALFLTGTASSAPLANAWTDVGQKFVDFVQPFERFLPRGGPGTRITGVSFGPSTTIVGKWVADPSPVLTIHVPVNDTTRYYWRAVTYDRFDINGWSYTDSSTTDVPANTQLLQDTPEDVSTQPGYRQVQVQVDPLRSVGGVLFSPGIPLTTSVSSHEVLVGPSLYLGGLTSDSAGSSYTMTAEVPNIGDDTEGGLTQNKLRAAGTDYPFDIKRLYLDVPAGSVGPYAKQLLDTVYAQSGAKNPYDLAQAMVQYLQSDRFTYSLDVTGIPCNGESVVECFARTRTGYCQHYASEMAILLRVAHIPTRLVQGFLPGDRDPRTGNETILLSNSHAWVEVYFPNYGWVPFDPTGGGVAQLAPLPTGKPVPSATPKPSGSTNPNDNGQDPFRRRTGPNLGGGTTSDGGSAPGSAPFIVVGVLLVISIGGLAFIAWQRGPRGPVQADAVYRGITRLAGRFGYGPSPTQTVYEYAEALGDVLPVARPPLDVVARAKVEVAYGRQALGDDRLMALRAAQRRLRVTLLRLALRRPRKGRS